MDWCIISENHSVVFIWNILQHWTVSTPIRKWKWLLQADGQHSVVLTGVRISINAAFLILQDDWLIICEKLESAPRRPRDIKVDPQDAALQNLGDTNTVRKRPVCANGHTWNCHMKCIHFTSVETNSTSHKGTNITVSSIKYCPSKNSDGSSFQRHTHTRAPPWLLLFPLVTWHHSIDW